MLQHQGLESDRSIEDEKADGPMESDGWIGAKQDGSIAARGAIDMSLWVCHGGVCGPGWSVSGDC